ncbi:hypothetical protein SAMN06272737_120102 [Blastococcus mobilis]|uniref:Uncharacterized protein n=1 Tax=Blastococcus mobilis TaxID=1938746 RepID=A0A238YL28_9ACTN|nr:hypothetical protein SAMN06272737_120102 [Blastococcus mobilis]
MADHESAAPGGHRPRLRDRLVVSLLAGLLAALAVTAATGLLSGRPIGAADNGDGVRLYCGAGLVPATPTGSANWVGGVVLDFVAGGAPCPLAAPSSARAALELALGGATGPWSLTELGWLYAVAVALVSALAAWAATAGQLVRVLVLVPAVLPLANADFARFFLSTYGEPAGLVGAFAVCAGTAAVAVTRPRHRSARWAALLLTAGGGLVAGTAKPGYLPLLLLAVAVCAVTAVAMPGRRRWLARVPGPVVAGALVAASVVPISAALQWQDRAYPGVNAHNLVFTLVLPEVGRAAVDDLGLPEDATSFAGRSYYPDGPSGVPGADRIAADPDGIRAAAWQQLVSHPAALALAVGIALQATHGRGLAYLTARPWSPDRPLPEPESPVGEQGATADALHRWLDGMGLPWLPSVLATIGIAVGAAAGLLRPPLARGLARMSGVTAAGALGLAVVAVLGDGYFEIAKHVWLSAYLLDVVTGALTMCVVSLVGVVARRPAGARRALARVAERAGSAG